MPKHLSQVIAERRSRWHTRCGFGFVEPIECRVYGPRQFDVNVSEARIVGTDGAPWRNDRVEVLDTTGTEEGD